MERPVFIYALIDPRDGRTRYIGKAVNLYRRLGQHVRDKHKGNAAKIAWCDELGAISLKPEIRPVFTTTEDAWESDERRMIVKYRKDFPDLLNIQPGGIGVKRGPRRGHGVYGRLINRFNTFLQECRKAGDLRGELSFKLLIIGYQQMRDEARRSNALDEFDAWLLDHFGLSLAKNA